MKLSNLFLHFVLIFVSACFTYITILLYNYDNQTVKIHIQNKSGHNIESYSLVHNTGRGELQEKYKIPNGGKTLICFPTGGEDTYKLTIKLDNDSSLLYHEDYVEGGYKLRLIVLEKEIKRAEN